MSDQLRLYSYWRSSAAYRVRIGLNLRSEEHTSELQSPCNVVCRLLLEKKVQKGKVKPRWVTQLALSVDHRLVDGELASRVLHDVATTRVRPEQARGWG